jgi:diketogulonate reductase-like aldo/keto reductase
MMHDMVRLSNGFLMPTIGIGTYGLSKESAKDIVMLALKLGYRHIETAPIYMNEQAIGEAIKASGIPRDALFITSKIPPHVKTYDGTLRTAKRSLDALGVAYLDALLINNPVPWGKEDEDFSLENAEVWRALETLYGNEAVASIGVSNFDVHDLKQMMASARVMPQINQLGIFIGHPLDAIRSYCHEKGIVVQAHSPLARGRLLSQDILVQEASRHGLTPASLALSYVYAKGAYPIVKASTRTHLLENLSGIIDLPDALISRLDEIKQDVRDYMPPGAKRVL